VWVMLQAGLCEYRISKYGSALGLFKLCEEIVSGPLLCNEQSCRFGTRARALYSLGLVYRERGRLQTSIRCFTKSAELAYSSFERQKAPSPLASVAIARSLGMGLASVFSMLGRPDLAIPLLLAAKAMLPPSEKVISIHLNLIRATLGPWSYTESLEEDGENTKSLKPRPLEEIADCYTAFERASHLPYQTRAAYYQAREYLRIAGEEVSTRPSTQEMFLKKAEGLLGEIESSTSGDERFVLLGSALRSEIARRRGDFQLAEERAGWGLRKTSSTWCPAIHLDLLTNRALALAALEDYDGAGRDLRASLRLAAEAGNQYLRAKNLLYLCQTYLKAHLFREASQSFNDFKELQRFLEVEPLGLRTLRFTTEALLDQHEKDDYVLRLRHDLDPEEEQGKFRRALVRWARANSKTDAAAAKKLNISRQTLNNWQKEK
jgi:tetratricopeptide (TPR) repeat protein